MLETQDNFLDLAQLDAIPDQVLLENNQEYALQVIKAEIGESGPDRKTAGQKYLKVTFKAIEEPDSRPFNDIFMLPFAGLDQDKFNMRGRQLRDFLQAAQFDYTSGWNILTETNELVGIEVNAVVRVRESDEYGDQNEVKRYIQE